MAGQKPGELDPAYVTATSIMPPSEFSCSDFLLKHPVVPSPHSLLTSNILPLAVAGHSGSAWSPGISQWHS